MNIKINSCEFTILTRNENDTLSKIKGSISLGVQAVQFNTMYASLSFPVCFELISLALSKPNFPDLFANGMMIETVSLISKIDQNITYLIEANQITVNILSGENESEKLTLTNQQIEKFSHTLAYVRSCEQDYRIIDTYL